MKRSSHQSNNIENSKSDDFSSLMDVESSENCSYQKQNSNETQYTSVDRALMEAHDAAKTLSTNNFNDRKENMKSGMIYDLIFEYSKLYLSQ